jgi:subtilase family serine protease
MILPLFIVPRKKLRYGRSVPAGSIELLEDRNLLAAGIDLLPQNLQAPSSAVVGSGQTIAVEFSIENAGDTDAPDVIWFDNLYLSDDETFGDGDVFLGAVIQTDGVLAGGSYTKSVDFAVPNTTPGNRFLLVVSDDGNGLTEVDESNNVLARPIQLLPATVNLDLTGSASGPATGLLGSTIEVSYTINNTGPDAMTAAFLFTRVWLSGDSSLDLGDTILDLRGLPAPLASGESFTDTWDLSLFTGTPGAQFLLFEIDASNTQFEQDENNNVVSVPINLTSVELEASATAPATASIAEPLFFQGTVTNSGSVAPTASGWTDRVYLSADPIFDGSDALLDFRTIDPLLETIGPGQSYTKDYLLDLSGAPLGSQYLIFVSDQENNQPELDKQNNIAVVSIDIFSPFDLSITASVSPDTFNVDDSVTLNWTVTNNGSATANGNWFDSVYLSDDPFFDPTDEILLSASANSIGPGESYSQAIPSVMTRGAAYLIFVADAGRNLAEFDEANNTFAVPINVVSGPDVAVTPTSVPETIVIGDSLTVEWDITNNGDADVVTPWQDTVFLSTNDAVFDGDDIFVGSFFHNNVPLNPGQTVSGSISTILSNNGGGGGEAARALSAVPQGLAPGSYQLIIVSRYFDADRNIFDNVSRTPVTLVVPDVDLVASDGIVPLEITLGDIVNFSVTATNSGSVTTNASFLSAGMYYSTDDIFDESDILIGAGVTFSALGPGESEVISASAVFDQGSAGPGYVLLVVNPFADQAETNLDNNVVAIAVDFVAADISVTGTAPSSGVAGTTASLSITVTNSGSVIAPAGSFRSDAIYLSTDSVLSFDDVSLFSQATTIKYPLAPGDSYTFSPTVSIPSRPAGSYYILFVADSSQRLPESDEANNVLAVPFELLSAQGNLQVVSNTAPTALSVGPLPSFSYTVQNTGTGLSSGTWFDTVYLSSTPTITFSSTLLSLTSQTRSLTPGQSYVNTVSGVTIGSRPAGNYFLIFAADEGNGLAESNESDNLVVIPVTVDGPDLQVISIDAPNQVNVGDTFNITYTVQNFGTQSTTVSWSDFVAVTSSGFGNVGAVSASPPAASFPLDPGESYTFAVSIPVSLNQAPGNYTIRVTANLSGLQPELVRSNNFLDRAITFLDVPLPDLVVTSVEVPAEIVATKEFDLSWTVANQGESSVTLPWIDTVSVVGLNQPFATTLGQFSSSVTLAPGESIRRTQRLLAPNFVGDLRFTLTTDSAFQLAEGFSGGTRSRPAGRCQAAWILAGIDGRMEGSVWPSMAA